MTSARGDVLAPAMMMSERALPHSSIGITHRNGAGVTTTASNRREAGGRSRADNGSGDGAAAGSQVKSALGAGRYRAQTSGRHLARTAVILLVRLEFSAGLRACGRGRGTSDRRADCCGLALSQSRIPGPALPPAARPGRRRLLIWFARVSKQGVKIGRLTENKELVPYHDRRAIEAGALDGQRLEICWIRNPLEMLTIQIQGSGRVILEDGTALRVGFDSHNGYRFSSIERVLIDRNLIARNEISPRRIRDWMATHPDEAAKVRAANRSYVFFRVSALSNEGEPIGAQGVPLTAGRSIAVDRVHEYGTPFFIEANLPIRSGRSVSLAAAVVTNPATAPE
jgi:hypothetical protein